MVAFSTLLSTATTGTVLVLLAAAPVSAEFIFFGGVNVDEACKQQYGSNFSAHGVGNGKFDWRCTSGNDSRGVDIGRWCKGKYGDSAYAVNNNGDLFGWNCAIP